MSDKPLSDVVIPAFAGMTADLSFLTFEFSYKPRQFYFSKIKSP